MKMYIPTYLKMDFLILNERQMALCYLSFVNMAGFQDIKQFVLK